MLKSSLLLFALLLTAGFSSRAAIDCKPGMGNCPDPDMPGHPSTPAPGSSPYLAIGYAEIPSPNCEPADRIHAQTLAKEKALQEAQDYFGTTQLTELPGSHLSEGCERGFYANSAPGLSWIVQYFAHYSKN
jgi:hypothetical protein